MSMFGTPSTDATLAARVAALEAQLAALGGTVADNAGAAGAAIGDVAGDRVAGDQAAQAAIDAAIAGSVARVDQVASQLGNEIVIRAHETNILGQKVDAVKGESIHASVMAATDAIADDVAAIAQAQADVLTARDQAQAAAVTAMFDNIYADYAAGLAATANGQQWVSYGPAAAYATRWLKTGANAATPIDAYPSKSVVDLLTLVLQKGAGAGMAVVDQDGLSILFVDGSGKLFVREIALSDMVMKPTGSGHITIVDADGLVAHTTDPAYTRTLTALDGIKLDRLIDKIVLDRLSGGMGVSDPDGLCAFFVDQWGNFTAASAQLRNIRITDGAPGKLRITDPDGLVAFDSDEGEASATTSPGDAALAARAAANGVFSTAVAQEFNTRQQGIVRGAVNIFICYGQSLSRGQEGWPALSRTPRNDGNVFSYGQSTRPWTQTGTTFDPLIDASLHPMIAVVNLNNAIVADAAVAALPPGTNYPGEGPEIGAFNFLRAAYLDRYGVEADADTPWIVLSCGVGGQQISALSKPSSQVSDSYYNRILDGLSKVMALPGFAGRTFRVPAIMWLQGEEDYEQGGASANPSKAAHMAALRQLRADLDADIASLTGQSREAAFVTYQTSGVNTRDALDMFVGAAQLEVAIKDIGWHLAAPFYPATDKGVHGDANAYRWAGMQFGKVLSRVLLRKEGWKPLYPRRATVSGIDVLIDFHVPCPPLQWGQPYHQLVATDYATKGFVVRDDVGDIALSGVEIAAPSIVRLTLSRETVGVVHVEGGTFRGSQGNVCLKDSDPTIATERYEYNAGTGQYAGANIPALVGKPYPLENWCVNFSIIAEAI